MDHEENAQHLYPAMSPIYTILASPSTQSPLPFPIPLTQPQPVPPHLEEQNDIKDDVAAATTLKSNGAHSDSFHSEEKPALLKSNTEPSSAVVRKNQNGSPPKSLMTPSISALPRGNGEGHHQNKRKVSSPSPSASSSPRRARINAGPMHGGRGRFHSHFYRGGFPTRGKCFGIEHR